MRLSRANPAMGLLSALALSLVAPHVLESQSPSAPQARSSSQSGDTARNLSAEEVFKRFASRVVFLTCDVSEDGVKLASGVLVSPDGFIITNAHVVEGCRSVTALLITGKSRRSYEALLKYSDKKSDTAVLKIQAKGLDSFDVLARPVRVGERVYAIGNPRELEQSISEGIVSGLREGEGAAWIQHSAPISPGSSGGALISSRGELLGINSWTITESQNLNFAVPAATLAEALSGAALTGTYSGTILNRTAWVSAEFDIILSESGADIVRGCMAVKPPLIGSGHLLGSTHGLRLSFVVVNDSARLEFDGQRDADTLSGTYSATSSGRPAQSGTFTLHKTSAKNPYGESKEKECPNDAKVTREVADRGDATAQLTLGLLYYEGRGVSRDLAQAAEQGNPEAQATLGAAYEMGLGVEQDYVEAAAWYRDASDQGYAEAQWLLGRLHETGKGVPKDDIQAAAWYRKAAEGGNASAQNRLGGMYSTGEGVAQDHAEAAKWYRKAAEQGDASAQLILGVAYHDGDGVPEDYAESYFWIKLAAAGSVPGVKPDQLESLLAKVAAHLTPEVLSQAQVRAGEWLASYTRNQQ